tara:strand:- start:791 stop:985 length:195 start_codon:yes stop_codon:yes gene_type:complete
MKKKLNWLDKEKEKDKVEIAYHKKKLIKDILLTTPKKITSGFSVVKKKSLWTKIVEILKITFKI